MVIRFLILYLSDIMLLLMFYVVPIRKKQTPRTDMVECFERIRPIIRVRLLGVD